MAVNLLTLAQQNKKALNKADAESLKQITNAYTLVYSRLTGDIDALILAMEGMEDVTEAKVKSLPQYKRLIEHAEREMDNFGITAATLIATAAVTAANMGLANSRQIINLATGGGFTGLQSNALIPLLHFLDPEGGLYQRLEQLTGNTVGRVVDQIIDGVLNGYNPRRIAGLIQDAFGGGLTDALRNARTVQIWSYREGTRANYIASDGIVKGWIWFAELDADVCMSCVAQHGTIHELDEMLDDHDNGRCAMLAYIPELGNPVQQQGEEWFNNLPEDEQRGMMGNTKWEAWHEGKFEFSQLSVQHPDERYGSMRTEASLISLIGDTNE